MECMVLLCMKVRRMKSDDLLRHLAMKRKWVRHFRQTEKKWYVNSYDIFQNHWKASKFTGWQQLCNESEARQTSISKSYLSDNRYILLGGLLKRKEHILKIKHKHQNARDNRRNYNRETYLENNITSEQHYLQRVDETLGLKRSRESANNTHNSKTLCCKPETEHVQTCETALSCTITPWLWQVTLI